MAEGCSSSAEFVLELLEEEEVGRMECFQLVDLLEEVVEVVEEGWKGQNQEELKQETSQEVLLEHWRSGRRTERSFK